MKQIKSDQKVENMEKVPEFKGYTIEELRHQRTVIALRKEFCKARLIESINELRPGHGKKDSGKSNSKIAFVGKLASKIFSNLNFFDYLMIGMSAFGTAKKGVKLLKKKK